MAKYPDLGELPSEPVPGEHYWLSPERMAKRWPSLKADWSCCLWCGIIKRRDGKNSPCRGRVGISLRSKQ